jgi:hypothetical protein
MAAFAILPYLAVCSTMEPDSYLFAQVDVLNLHTAAEVFKPKMVSDVLSAVSVSSLKFIIVRNPFWRLVRLSQTVHGAT